MCGFVGLKLLHSHLILTVLRRTQGVLAALWLAAAGPAAAQQYHLRHYAVDDGLPSSLVRDVTQDDRGRMWFATRAGIATYDGRQWQTFNLAHGLSWADQFALRWDRGGGLWSVSSIAPFKVFRREGERWREVAGPAKISPECRITAFAVLGGGADPRLAIGTAGDGILLWDGRGAGATAADPTAGPDSWRQITRREGLPDDRIADLAVWGDRLIIATAGGLAELRQGRVEPLLLEPPVPSPAIAGLALESADLGADPGRRDPGRLWILGDGWIGQLAGRPTQRRSPGRFTLLGDRLPVHLDAPQVPSDGPRGDRPPTRVVARPDHQGGIYFAHPGALFYFHPALGLEPLGRHNGLLSEGATSLWVDREDNLWIAGPRGITKVVTRRFASYTRQQGLYGDEVTAAFERRDGEIVLGHRGGISLVAGGTIRTLPLGDPPAAGQAASGRPFLQQPERVRDFAQDRAGNLWLAADTQGLARLDAAGPAVWFGEPQGLTGDVTSVLVDSRGELWAATVQGLFRRRGSSFERISAVSRTAASRIAAPIHVRRVFEGAPGELLMATPAGLHRFADGVWSAWTCGEGGGCNSVFAVLPRAAGGLWAGTSAGLYRTAGDGLTKVAAGLAIDRPIFFMVRDRLNRIWFGTDNGVVRWDGTRLQHFTVKDGLAGRETHRAAGLVDSRGDVWIGTERGATVYSERLPGPRPVPPIVELDRVEASGRLESLASPLALGSDENDLIFQFEVVSLIDESRVQISRRLEGFEAGWRPLDSPLDRQVRYTNLPPGEYRLHLKAANARGVWSDAIASAAITIARPYWQQPWFFLALVSVLATAFVSVQRHLAQKRYSRRLEAEVATRVAELDASEERYRHIFERSQAVKLLVDVETQRIIDANRAACRFYGYPLEDLKGRSLDDLRVEEPEPVDLATDSGTHLLAERHRRSDGEVRDVELYSSAAAVEQRPIFYVIVQDVTERRLAEETMFTEKERMAATLRNIDDGVITTDSRGKILLLNRKAEEITGWSAAAVVGRPLEEVLRLHEAREGSVHPDELGEPLELVSGQEAAPLASGVWRAVPSASGRGLVRDPAFRRLAFGRSANRRSANRRVAEAFEPIDEAVLLTRVGEHKLVELSGSPIRQAERISGLVLAFRDITERRQIESELARTQKLEALGLLAGGIAHDFNNLLTVLLGNLSLLSLSPDLDGPQTKSLDDAQGAVLRARDLTQQLLTFARGGTPVRQAASIAEVISESASFVLSGSKVRCEIELPEDLWVVEIDAGQISQVVNNLLINAMQAMPEGGTVRVRGENLSRPPGSLVGNYVVIQVSDEGVGIPREYLNRIFDPYFSTKEKGRGLGLASAYSIAQQHDGLLEVASEPGRGTLLSLYLPASEAQAVTGRADEAEAFAGSGRLLIMDDDEQVRTVTGSMVEQLGYRAAYAADGAEAIESYRQALSGAEPFDAVIMDLTIPGGMGGQAAIRHLLELDPQVRAIVASGYSNDPVLANYRTYGFRGRISKPFQTEDLVRAMREVLAPRPASAGAAG